MCFSYPKRQSLSFLCSYRLDAFDSLWLWSISCFLARFLSCRSRSPSRRLSLHLIASLSSGQDQWPPSVYLVSVPCSWCLNVLKLFLPFPITPQTGSQLFLFFNLSQKKSVKMDIAVVTWPGLIIWRQFSYQRLPVTSVWFWRLRGVMFYKPTVCQFSEPNLVEKFGKYWLKYFREHESMIQHIWTKNV